MSNGFTPQAFHEYSKDYSQWTLIRMDGRNEVLFAPPPSYVATGEQQTALAEPMWKETLRQWNDLVTRKEVRIDYSSLEDDEICFVLAQQLKDALNDVEPFNTIQILPAAVSLIGEKSKQNLRGQT